MSARPSHAVIAACALCAAAPALAQGERPAPLHQRLDDPKTANVEIVGHVLEPAQLEPTQERLDQLSLPPGFRIDVFAEGLANPRMMAVADDGTVYVTRRSVGDLLMLRDADGDGRADVQERVASRPMMHGVAVDGDVVYMVTVEDVYRATRREDGTLGPLERIVDGLPAGGQHPNRTVVVGPDGKLYVSVGSTCNACAETDARNATMMRFEPDGGGGVIFASGLRNTIGYGFAPGTDQLWGMDHGIDWLGDHEQHEELNLIVQGAKYGWPYVYGDDRPNPQDHPPAGITMEEWAAESAEPAGLYTPHSAPMQMAFYTGDAFPESYRGDAFVAMRGSWNRKPPSGYEVLRIDFEDGRPVAFEPFVTGFLMEAPETGPGWGHLGRLAGMAQGPDGALYLSDDANGVIYRISYEGPEDGEASLRPTNAEGPDVLMTEAPAPEAPASERSGLAHEILGADAGLEVRSEAFGAEEPIPADHAAERLNISPQISWSGAPEGTRSYAVIVEDPDAPQDAPFVHWILYDVPAGTTDLREGVPGAPRLPLPEGAAQGANDHGSLGWFGMKPPAGDAPHSYHFQVFALDGPLELPHGAARADVLAAMEGRVLAFGELVGSYQR